MQNAIREKLLEYINMTNERKIEAIYIMLEDDIASYGYSNEEIELFHERREKHLRGESLSYPPEQSLNMIRASRK